MTMTEEIPVQDGRCNECNQRKTVTKTGSHTCEIQCGCCCVEVTTTLELPEW